MDPPAVLVGPARQSHARTRARRCAYEYVIGYDEPSSFPFPVASSLMNWFGDDERRRAVFRRADCGVASRAGPHFGTTSLPVFVAGWKALPEEEAREAAREIVRVTLSQPDWPITATYDHDQTVRITSGRMHSIFTILHVLRRP